MDIDGTYDINVTVGSKHYSGTAEVTTYDDMAWVTLDAPKFGTFEGQGKAFPDGSISVSGSTRVLLKRITYTVDAHLEGDILHATVRSNIGTISVTGTPK